MKEISKRQLETIQTKKKLNNVYSVDEKGAGGAHHLYRVEPVDTENGEFCLIQFQNGARHVEGSIAGIIDSDLLEIVRDRLSSFQNGAFACPYNAEALEHVEAALKSLNARIENRINRNVLGTNNA